MPSHCSSFSPLTSVLSPSSGSKLCVTEPQKQCPYQNSSIHVLHWLEVSFSTMSEPVVCTIFFIFRIFVFLLYFVKSVVYWYRHLLSYSLTYSLIHSLALQPSESLSLLNYRCPFFHIDCLLLSSLNLHLPQILLYIFQPSQSRYIPLLLFSGYSQIFS